MNFFYAARLRRGFAFRFGRLCFTIKPTEDELFSQRNGYWKAFRVFGISLLFQRRKK